MQEETEFAIATSPDIIMVAVLVVVALYIWRIRKNE